MTHTIKEMISKAHLMLITGHNEQAIAVANELLESGKRLTNRQGTDIVDIITEALKDMSKNTIVVNIDVETPERNGGSEYQAYIAKEHRSVVGGCPMGRGICPDTATRDLIRRSGYQLNADYETNPENKPRIVAGDINIK
jgi:hypothetical protein